MDNLCFFRDRHQLAVHPAPSPLLCPSLSSRPGWGWSQAISSACIMGRGGHLEAQNGHSSRTMVRNPEVPQKCVYCGSCPTRLPLWPLPGGPQQL